MWDQRPRLELGHGSAWSMKGEKSEQYHEEEDNFLKTIIF